MSFVHYHEHLGSFSGAIHVQAGRRSGAYGPFPCAGVWSMIGYVRSCASFWACG